jgi:serine/threonine-protein kinase
MVGALGPSIGEGEILAAKYRLERELGRGTMGTVWAATHLTLQQRVAIKFIAPEFANSVEARLRFRTEARAAAHLKSRYVVQVYDDGETVEGTPYIVMQYLEGETLEQRLEREGSLPLFDAVRISAHVARALRRAHSHGIVHRDLKPGNIYLCRSDEDEHGWVAKVLDFGVAKTEGFGDRATTKPGAILGTPLFMSPEQIERASLVDHRADIYSLGVCFFNMVTGRYPFEEQSFTGVLMAICTRPLPDLRTLSPGLPEAVNLWFERCCARKPESRFQSADEAFVALQAAAEHVGPVPLEDTLHGHRAPLSRRDLPLGTKDSPIYGSDASHRAPSKPARRVSVALTLALAGVAVLGTLAAFAVARFESAARESNRIAEPTNAADAAPTNAASAGSAFAAANASPSATPQGVPRVELAAAADSGATAFSARAPAPRVPPQARKPKALPSSASRPGSVRGAPTDLGF